MNSKPVCFVDLDGVLVDFFTGALRAHGQYIPYPDMKWDFWEQFDPVMTAKDFWTPLGYEFWKGLPWTPGGKKFLQEAEAIFGERVVILTSPTDTPGSVEGKVDWIRRELPAYRRKFFVGPPKELAAGPTKVLVDDYDKNTDKFEAEGGRSVLVPCPWNRRYYDSWANNGHYDPASVANELRSVHLSITEAQ